MSARLVIRWPCYECAVDHETLAWRTTTPGLVVMRPAPDCPNDGGQEEWWSVTHALSGLALPRWFDGPEGAMAAAAHLGSAWDWTRPIAPPVRIQRSVIDTLTRFGGTSDGSLPAMPPDVRNPEAVTQ